jgi:hypothetical protein
VCLSLGLQEAERRVQESMALQQALAELAAGGAALVSRGCCQLQQQPAVDGWAVGQSNALATSCWATLRC